MPSNQLDVQQLQTTWTFASPYGVPNQPLLMAGDRLLGINDQRVIYAINIYTGQELRTQASSTPGTPGFPYTRRTSQVPELAVADGAVFFMDDGKLVALQLADGSARPGWTAPAIAGVTRLVGFAGVVVAIREFWGKTSVEAYRTSDGRAAWPSAPYTVSGFSSGAIGLAEDALFFVARNQLFAVNADYGDTRFPQDPAAAPAFPLDQTQAPLIGTAVVVCSGSNVFGFDRKTGALVWQFEAAAASNLHWATAMSGDGRWIAGVSSAGDVRVADTNTGAVIALTAIGEGGTPVIADQTIYVVGPDHVNLTVLTLDLVGKSLTSSGVFALGENLSAIAPTLGNGTLFIPTADGNVSAKPYVATQAAWFNGQTYVSVTPGTAGFAFGSGDFSIEAWVRSSEGGEILSSLPAAASTDAHGFRFNLSATGQLQFATLNGDGSNQDLARTAPTTAADGYWHHVAVSRSDGSSILYLDGVSQPVFSRQNRGGAKVFENGQSMNADGSPQLDTLTPRPPPGACDITPQQGLTIGAWISSAAAPPLAWFTGLLREVRVWDVALDAAALQSRMRKMLPPTLAHLAGNWHLDLNANEGLRITNDVALHEFPATFTGGSSVPTDISLDDSAFPYVLHQPKLQWPYASSWIVRGEKPIEDAPAISDDGVLCFATNNALYGVNKSDGSRVWDIPINVACSRPVADGCSFLVMTDQFGLIRIAARTGSFEEVNGFQPFQATAGSTFLAAPATDGQWLAAAAPDGRVGVMNANGQSAVVSFPTAADPGDLTVCSGIVYTVTGGASGPWTLYAIDPVLGKTASVPVSGPIFTAFQRWVFSLQGGQLVRTGSDLSAIAATASVAGAHVTGLAPDGDANLLAVSTDTGQLLGLSLATLGQRWNTVIPDGGASSPRSVNGFLNPPVVDGRIVYCTSRSGTVAAVDGRTGSIVGLFFEVNGVMTRPLESAGVVYFGCDDAGPTSPLDGALHSVVFGTTCALRLGYTPSGVPMPGGYASIESPAAQDAIYFRSAQQCCVEAWVNSTRGGDVVSLSPSSASQIGLRLWLDPATGVNFSLMDQPSPGAAWQTLQATAAANGLFDGRWHHVAVSAQSATDVRIYLDGKAQTVTRTPGTATPSGIVTGLSVALGANYEGLIGEVRLWDTYLVASEISSRMHDKLRGDEADLLAYWNFDTFGVHDASRNGYDGALAGTGGGFWLTDLSFEQPDYPYFTTKAAVLSVGEAGLPATDSKADTVYQLTVLAHQANGSPLSGADIQFWYVRHQDIGEPATIAIAAGVVSATLTGILPGEAEPATGAGTSWIGTTDSSGQVSIQVRTTDLAHGPSFDIRSDFMPANERYHVNVLLNSQKLLQPTPPWLSAQSKLLHDYHWTTGSKIDSTRGRPVYRTTITAFNADNSPRANERIEIFASGFLDIEVAGQDYSLSLQNNAALYTDAEGEVTLLVDATDLKTASLSVWAGFMNAQARYTINPAEDAHASLAAVQGPAMSDGTRMKVWKPASEGGPTKGALLATADQPHAGDISAAVRHVMSSGADATAPASSPAPSGGGTSLGLALPRAPFADMSQRGTMPQGDVIRSLPTLKHINRRSPVTPEAMLASMPAGAVGFSFSVPKGAGSLQFQYHYSEDDARKAMGTATPSPATGGDIALGGWFSDLWSDISAIVDFAEELYEDALKITVLVNDAINVMVQMAGNTFIGSLIDSIAHAISLVGNFFKQLALDIVAIIQFLEMLFDWDDILRAHAIVKQICLNLGDLLVNLIGDGTSITSAFATAFASMGLPAPPAVAGASSPTALQHEGAAQPNAASSAPNGVGSRSMYGKTKEHQGGMTIGGAAGAADAAAGATAGVATDLDDFIKGLVNLVGDLPSMNAHDALAALLKLLETVAADVLQGVAATTVSVLQGLANSLSSIVGLLDASVDIPFISALYKWITGTALSLLDLFCLILGVGVHITYGILTLGRVFADDAAGLPAMLSAPAPQPALGMAEGGDSMLLGAPLPAVTFARPDSRAAEISYMFFRSLNTSLVMATDMLFAEQLGAPDTPARSWFKVFRGMTGVTSTVLINVCSTPDYIGKLEAAMVRNQFKDSGEDVSVFYQVTAESIFALSALGDLITLFTGAYSIWKGNPQAASVTTVLGVDIDEGEFWFLNTRAVVLVMLAIRHLHEYQSGTEYGEPAQGADNADGSPGPQVTVGYDMATSSQLLLARNLCFYTAMLPGGVFTKTAADMFGTPSLYVMIGCLRQFATIGGLVCHGVAEFDYLLNMPEPAAV